MSVMTTADPAEALASRYGSDHRPAGILWNDTIALLLSHRSVRSFSDTPLPDETLETLTAAAQSAATSSNQQAWSIVAVTDPALKADIAALAGNQKHITDAPLLLVWVADLARGSDIVNRAGAPLEAFDYLESFAVAAVDASLAAQNAAIAAESLGLGTVYIGGIRNQPAEVATRLGLPLRSFALFGLVVGVPDVARPTSVKPRLPQSAVLHRNRYCPHVHVEAVPVYDTVSRLFQQSQGLPETGWVTQLVSRSRSAAMSGRQSLREALKQRGFPLL